VQCTGLLLTGRDKDRQDVRDPASSSKRQADNTGTPARNQGATTRVQRHHPLYIRTSPPAAHRLHTSSICGCGVPALPRPLSMEGRMTICNLRHRNGRPRRYDAPTGTAPPTNPYALHKDREFAPPARNGYKARRIETNCTPTKTQHSLRISHIMPCRIEPMITYCTNPGMAQRQRARIPGFRRTPITRPIWGLRAILLSKAQKSITSFSAAGPNSPHRGTYRTRDQPILRHKKGQLQARLSLAGGDDVARTQTGATA